MIWVVVPPGPGRTGIERTGDRDNAVSIRSDARTETDRVVAPAEIARSRLFRYSPILQTNDPMTAREHTPARPSIHSLEASVPIPKEWDMATGQLP